MAKRAATGATASPRTRTASRRSAARRPTPPAAAAGREFQKLVEIMARLRGPDGCPWDREQTVESLRGFVLEESYEVLEAIDRGDHAALLGEIGDLIFEGVFLAQVEADAGRFTISDSLRAITTKLVRRHPHIFGPGATGLTAAGEVLEQWEQIKAREQSDAGQRRSLLRGVPKALPSLLRAHEIGSRVAAVGFDWPRTSDVVEKIEEEVAELRRAVDGEGAARAEEEMGDLLFTIANLARKLGIEPESALRKANDKFSARFDALEHALEARGESVDDATLEVLETEWRGVKQREAVARPDGPYDIDAAPAAGALHEPKVGSKDAKNAKDAKKATNRQNSARSRGSGRRPGGRRQG